MADSRLAQPSIHAEDKSVIERLEQELQVSLAELVLFGRLMHAFSQHERARSERLANCLRSVQQQLRQMADGDDSVTVNKTQQLVDAGLLMGGGAHSTELTHVDSSAASSPSSSTPSGHHAKDTSQIQTQLMSHDATDAVELDATAPVGCAISELRPQPALVQQGADAGNGLSGWEIIGKLKSSSHKYPIQGAAAHPFPLTQTTCSDSSVRVYGYSAPSTGVTASSWHSLPSLVIPLEPPVAQQGETPDSAPLPAMAGPNTDVLATSGGAGDASLRLWRGAAMAALGCTATKKHRVAGGEGLPMPAMCSMQLQSSPTVHGSGALVAPAITAMALSTSLPARAWGVSTAHPSQAPHGQDSRVDSCLTHWAATKLQPAVPRVGTTKAVAPSMLAPAAARHGGGVAVTGTSAGQLLAWCLPVELYTQDLSDSGTGKPEPLVQPALGITQGEAFNIAGPTTPSSPAAADAHADIESSMWHIGHSHAAGASSVSAHTAAVTGVVSLGEVGGHLAALAASVSTEPAGESHRLAFAGDDALGLEQVPDSMCLAGCQPSVLAAWYRARHCPAFVSVGEDGWLRVWALHVDSSAAATLVLSFSVSGALQERGVVGSPPCQVHPTQLVVDPTSAPSLCVLVGTSTGHVVKLDILRGKWATHGHIMSDMLAAAMKKGVATLPKSLAAVEPLGELVDRVQGSREGPSYTAAVLRAGGITALSMHGSKPLLMAGTSGGWVAAFDSSSLQCQHVFLAHSCAQTSLVPSPAVPLDPPPSGISAGGVHPYQSFMVAQMYSSLPYDAIQGSGVGGLVVDPTGSVLISTGAADGAVRIWDFASGALMKEFSDTHRASALPLSAPRLVGGALAWGAISTSRGSTTLDAEVQEGKLQEAALVNLRGADEGVCRCATVVSIAPRSLYVTSQDESAAAAAAAAAGIVPMERDTAASTLSKLLVFSTGGADGVLKLFCARKPTAAPKFGIGGAARSPAGGTSKAASSAGRLLASSAARGRRKPSSAARLLGAKRSARGGGASGGQ